MLFRIGQKKKQKLKYDLQDNTFQIKSKFINQLPIRKNIFQMNEDKDVCVMSKKLNPSNEQSELFDPLIMESTMMAHLFTERIASIITIISIMLSLIEVHYYYLDVKHLYIIEYGLTVVLIINVIVGAFLRNSKDKARKIFNQNQVLISIVNLAIVIPHPNQIFSDQYNYFMHLLLILRLSIPFKYFIRSSKYYNSRGHRLMKLYGLTPQNQFFLSAKAIFREIPILLVVAIYVGFALLFSHCLYLVGMFDGEKMTFYDYFEIVMVTMPTVGYGQYKLVQINQRFIIVLILIFSACLNSFITLVMLGLLEMTIRQQSSYNLNKKLSIRSNMESLSKEYIIEQIKLWRQKSKDMIYRKELDFTFHLEFRQQKALYDSLNNNEMDKNFTYFKQTLHQLNIKNIQTNNLINTLLTKLVSYKQQSHKKKDYNFTEIQINQRKKQQIITSKQILKNYQCSMLEVNRQADV